HEPEPPFLDAARACHAEAWRRRGCRLRLRLCRRLRREDRSAQDDTDQRLHHRGCVITSTSAGCPRWTAAIARLSDGPRSFGLTIGPSAYHPIACASFA